MAEKTILERIELIEKRNKKVELDKKREISLTRKIAILCITYIVLGAYMNIIGIQQRYYHAIIPTIGFLVSTMGLIGVKKIREKKQK